MAQQNGGQEKTEKPTAKRRRDARKEGNVFQSRDVSTVVVLLGAFCAMRLLLPVMYRELRGYLTGILESAPLEPQAMLSPATAAATLEALLKCALPLLGIVTLCGIAASGAQTRFNVSFRALRPKFSKLNPITGMKKFFALRNVVELVKNLLKVGVLLALLVNVLQTDLAPIARMIDMNPASAAAYMLDLAFGLVIRVCIAFAAIAFADFLYQRWEYEKNLRMTKQEVKDEFKQTEGNPEIKGRIRRLQRQMAMSRMMQKVPQADVIIRNPTHVAVALRYDADRDRAPIVLAKGLDDVALRIVRVGEENGVFVTENKPLARALYASCELGQEIPADYYGAVAEILAYLYRLR